MSDQSNSASLSSFHDPVRSDDFDSAMLSHFRQVPDVQNLGIQGD